MAWVVSALPTSTLPREGHEFHVTWNREPDRPLLPYAASVTAADMKLRWHELMDVSKILFVHERQNSTMLLALCGLNKLISRRVREEWRLSMPGAGGLGQSMLSHYR